MRLGILLIIIGIVCIVGLVKPRIALFGYIWFGLMRPDIMAFAAHRFNLSTVLAVATLVASLPYLFNIRFLLKPIPILLILFQVVVGVSAVHGILPEYTWFEFNRFLRMSIMCLVIPVLITDEERFRELFLVTAASLGFMGFWWGLTSGVRGARIWYGPGGFMGDNNSFAVGLAMIVPFCWYARSIVKTFWAKAVYSAMLMGSIVAVILTFSRGGALALGVALVLLIMRTKNRMRSMVLLVLAVIPILAVVGVSYSERLSTIRTFEQDASALSRIVQIKIAYQLWTHRPLLGIGIGDNNYLFASRPFLQEGEGNYIVHNSFMQVLVHTGLGGFLLFTTMLLIALWTSWRSGARLWKTDRERAFYPMAIFVSLVAYTVASMTHPRAWFDFFYMLLIFASTWSAIMQRRPAAQDQPRLVMARPQLWQVPSRIPQASPAAPMPRA